MRKRFGCALVALILPCAVPCAAQFDGRSEIVGTVRDDVTHEPLPGARVQLVLGEGKQSAPDEYSGSNGEFTFRSRKGDYYVMASKEGYQTARVQVHAGVEGEANVTIELHRQPAGDSSATAPPDAVSAHQLSVPAKARDEYTKGVSLLNLRKDYRGAVDHFERAIRIFPSYYEAYAQKGVAHFYLGEATDAEGALRKSIDLSSGKYSTAIFDLAELYNNTGRFPEAEPVARQAIAAENSSWRGYYELSRALFGLKRPADAEPNAQKARELNSDYPSVYLVLTNIHLALHSYPAVLQDIDAYLKFVPNGPTSDQVRKTREKVQRALERTQEQSASVPRP